jgi:hypothetical protein
LHVAVGSTADHFSSVGAEGDTVDCIGMPAELRLKPARRGIPDVHRSLAATRRDPTAVRANRDTGDRRCVAAEGELLLPAKSP